MIQAMYSGVSGMKAFKADLDVIGNNIANINTVGYKVGRATFKEMLNQTMAGATGPNNGRGGTNPSQVGLGVVIGSVDVNLSQGSMQATGRQTDLAIEGNGFFSLGDGSNTFYTRDGTFGLDAQYNLVSASTGLKVLGWNADQTSGIVDTSAPITGASGIKIPVGGMSLARQTSAINVGGNLNASALKDDTYKIKFSVYDSLGLEHETQITFTKMDTDPITNQAQWGYKVTVPDANPTDVATGTLKFDDKGHSSVENVDISFDLADSNGSITPLAAKINFADVSQLNGIDTVDLTYQDGLPMGTLEGFSIGRDGLVSGTFSNGSSRAIGQVALAEFNNASGLSKAGNNLLRESPNSGTARIATPGTGSCGLIAAGFLEASNVDLANEFSNMIVAQRGFQANSRIITVSDEVLQELVSLKR